MRRQEENYNKLIYIFGFNDTDVKIEIIVSPIA